MKKMKFKGEVNGVVYTTVQEYNAALTAAINAGGPVNASSQTTSEEESADQVYVGDFLPRFNDTNYYLDELVSGNDEADAETFAQEMDYLSEAFEVIKKAVKEMSPAELQKYLCDIQDIVETIGDDDEDNEATAKALNEEREELVKRIAEIDGELNICKNAVPVIELYQDFYQDVLNLISPKEECGCNCDCKCKSSQIESNVYEVSDNVCDDDLSQVQDFTNKLKSMVEVLFGK